MGDWLAEPTADKLWLPTPPLHPLHNALTSWLWGSYRGGKQPFCLESQPQDYFKFFKSGGLGSLS